MTPTNYKITSAWNCQSAATNHVLVQKFQAIHMCIHIVIALSWIYTKDHRFNCAMCFFLCFSYCVLSEFCVSL